MMGTETAFQVKKITAILTNAMEYFYWEADSHFIVKNFSAFHGTKSSLLYSQ